MLEKSKNIKPIVPTALQKIERFVKNSLPGLLIGLVIFLANFLAPLLALRLAALNAAYQDFAKDATNQTYVNFVLNVLYIALAWVSMLGTTLPYLISSSSETNPWAREMISVILGFGVIIIVFLLVSTVMQEVNVQDYEPQHLQNGICVYGVCAPPFNSILLFRLILLFLTVVASMLGSGGRKAERVHK